MMHLNFEVIDTTDRNIFISLPFSSLSLVYFFPSALSLTFDPFLSFFLLGFLFTVLLRRIDAVLLSPILSHLCRHRRWLHRLEYGIDYEYEVAAEGVAMGGNNDKDAAKSSSYDLRTTEKISTCGRGWQQRATEGKR